MHFDDRRSPLSFRWTSGNYHWSTCSIERFKAFCYQFRPLCWRNSFPNGLWHLCIVSLIRGEQHYSLNSKYSSYRHSLPQQFFWTFHWLLAKMSNLFKLVHFALLAFKVYHSSLFKDLQFFNELVFNSCYPEYALDFSESSYIHWAWARNCTIPFLSCQVLSWSSLDFLFFFQHLW